MENRPALTLALRNGPIARVSDLTRLGLLAEPRGALFGGEVVGDGRDGRQRLGKACGMLGFSLAHVGQAWLLYVYSESWRAGRHVCAWYGWSPICGPRCGVEALGSGRGTRRLLERT